MNGVCLGGPRPRHRGGHPLHRPVSRQHLSYPHMYSVPRPFMHQVWPLPHMRSYPQYRPPFGGGPPPSSMPGVPLPPDHPGYHDLRSGAPYPPFDSWSPYPRGSARRSLRYPPHVSKFSYARKGAFRSYDGGPAHTSVDQDTPSTSYESSSGTEVTESAALEKNSPSQDVDHQMAQLSITQRNRPVYKEHPIVNRMTKNHKPSCKLLQDDTVVPVQCDDTSACHAYDTGSVTSDEGNSDSLLPRVIKPRKRRKKDRKPSNSSTTSDDSKKDLVSHCHDSSGYSDGKTFVTLKPYVPSFYDIDDDTCKEFDSPDRDDEDDEEEDEEEEEDADEDTVRLMSEDVESQSQMLAACNSSSDLSRPFHLDRVCACDKCVTSHGFPTPPSSPSSSCSYSSKKSSSSNVLACGDSGRLSSSVTSSSSGSDDETWPCPVTAAADRPLVRCLSEPTDPYKTTAGRPSRPIAPELSDSAAASTPDRAGLSSACGVAGRRAMVMRRYPAAGSGGGAGYRLAVVRGGASEDGRHRWPPSHNTAVRRRHSLNLQKTQLDFSLLHQYAERTPAPPPRQWIHINEPTTTKPVCQFSVMCYNVLCSKLATRQQYGYCPPWALEWEYRKKGIMVEIRKFEADIIALQEVETDAFHNFFMPELKKIGYDGIFSPKSRAKHMQEKEKKHVDGCAIFFRTSKFTLLKEHLIEFNQLAMANHDGSEDMLNRVMPKDNIGLAALLQTKAGAWPDSSPKPDKSVEKQNVLVCTAHIHWDPEFCDVKLIQTIMLMTEVRKIVQSVSAGEEPGGRRGHHRQQDGAGGVHLLLCGDLNSLPESGVVEFLTSGQVSMDHQDFKGHGYKNSLHKLTVMNKNHSHSSNSNLYTHSFRLRPAYTSAIMPYTNYTYDFKGIIDYIFHSTDTIITLAALGPINLDWFKDNKVVGCPHPHVPSDHFPLVVQLELRPFSMVSMMGASSGSSHPQQQLPQHAGAHPQHYHGNIAPLNAGPHGLHKNNGNMHR